MRVAVVRVSAASSSLRVSAVRVAVEHVLDGGLIGGRGFLRNVCEHQPGLNLELARSPGEFRRGAARTGWTCRCRWRGEDDLLAAI